MFIRNGSFAQYLSTFINNKTKKTLINARQSAFKLFPLFMVGGATRIILSTVVCIERQYIYERAPNCYSRTIMYNNNSICCDSGNAT